MEFSARVGMVVLVLLLAGLFVENLRNFSAQHLATLGARCAPFVARDLPPAPPSEDCCKAVRGADLVSVCGRITPEIESIISMQKVVDVASRCGKPIPSGTRCGSFTPPVSYPPPAAPPGMPGQPPPPLPRPPMPQMAASMGMPPPMPGGPGMPPPPQPLALRPTAPPPPQARHDVFRLQGGGLDPKG
ncbi:hypothetical protein EJ110_NYTH45314 [Nymphaea thermarum]|nr:hypothetical protein EJ110_NYTH45314 [Nymphaea thermarum]